MEMTPVPNHPTPPVLAKGAEVELCIDKLAFGGKALGRLDGLVVFVEHALPGQRVRVRITRKKAQFAEGRVVEVLEQSPAYTPPFCRHFGVCGGCQWQDLAYEEQLHWKHLQVQEALRQLRGLSPEAILAPVASPQPRYYRNKMEFTFAPRGWQAAGETAASRGLALGLHVGDSFERIFDLEECFLQSTQAPAIVREVRNWCRQSGLPGLRHPQPSGLLALSGAAGGQAHRPDAGAPHYQRSGRYQGGGGAGRAAAGKISRPHHPGAFRQPEKGPGGQR